MSGEDFGDCDYCGEAEDGFLEQAFCGGIDGDDLEAHNQNEGDESLYSVNDDGEVIYDDD
jgi:hypothetical protein